MKDAAREAMIHVMDLCANDTVLIVTDETKRSIGEAFAEAAREVGCRTDVFFLPEADRPLTAVPAELSAALADHSVLINMFDARTPEIPFRVQLMLAVHKSGHIRCGHGPGITETMMSGPMCVDFAALRRNSERLIAAFAGATTVHITTPGGTDLRLDITDRAFCHDSHITVEAAGNLPCGEIYCAPVETGADGLLVIDGVIGDVSLGASPLHITIEGGTITDLQSDDPQLVTTIETLTGADEQASVIGELGIGLNPGATLSGCMLEDEKASRTGHIAFGNNAEMPGGQNTSSVHRDFLFLRPTMDVDFRDGSRRRLMEEGDIAFGE